jgi:hypothetical protein
LPFAPSQSFGGGTWFGTTTNFAADLPPRLILEIDVSERLSVVVAHEETRGLFLDGPRRREAAIVQCQICF